MLGPIVANLAGIDFTRVVVKEAKPSNPPVHGKITAWTAKEKSLFRIFFEMGHAGSFQRP